MKYRITRDSDGQEMADLGAYEAITKAAGIIVNGGIFTAPRRWVTRPDAAIEGYTITAYTPPPDPPPPPPTEWRVRLSTVYSRLTVPANKAAMHTFLSNNPEAAERFREEGGVPNDSTALRTWLTNNGEDPDAVLAL